LKEVIRMKTIRWNILRKNIPSIDAELDRIKKLHPEWSNKEITQFLNGKFQKELGDLGAQITENQIRTRCKDFYKKTLVEFVEDISNMSPAEVAKIFETTLPETSYKNPVKIQVKNPNNPRVLFINAPLIGLRGNEKALKRALILAQCRGCDVVVLPGNLIWLDLKRYSNIKPIKSEFIAQEETEDLTFRSFKEKFDILVRELQKQFLDKNGKPHFKGKILISLGRTESELVGQYTNEIIRRLIAKAQRELRDERSRLKKQIKKSEDEDEIKNLKARIEGIEKRLSYVIMSNVDEGYIRKISKEILKYIIYVYEKALSAKVISHGRVFLDVGGLTFQVVQTDKDSGKDDAIKDTINTFREAAKHRDLPHIVAIAGRTNIEHSGAPISYRSRNKINADVHLDQLPVCINNKEIERKRKELNKIGEPFLRAISSPDLTPGVALYQGIREEQSGELVLRIETYSLPFLLNDRLFSSSKPKISDISFIELDSDPHLGSLYVVYYEIPKSPYIKYHFEMAHDFLQHIQAPITGYINLGDLLQGHHFPFEIRPRRDLKIPSEVLKNFNKLWKKDLVKQILIRGVFPCQKQVEEYERVVLDGYEDYFLNIIKRATKLKTRFSGDLAPVVILGGNHFINSLEKEMNDGVIISALLRNRLNRALRGLGLNPDEVIKSPHWGDQPVGGGVLKFCRGGEYAITLRHKAIGGAAKFDDPIRKIRDAYRKRGTIESWQQGRFTFSFSGHTHRGGFSHGPHESFDIGACQVFHDPFGEKLGFPLNYIASKVIGIPVKGIAWGPIVRIPLEYSLFKKISKYYKKWKVDTKALFGLSVK